MNDSCNACRRGRLEWDRYHEYYECDRCRHVVRPDAVADAAAKGGRFVLARVFFPLALAAFLLMRFVDLGQAAGRALGLPEFGGQLVLVSVPAVFGLVWPRVGIVGFRALGLLLTGFTVLLALSSLLGSPDWLQVLKAAGLAAGFFAVAAFFHGHAHRRFVNRTLSFAALLGFLAVLWAMYAVRG